MYSFSVKPERELDEEGRASKNETERLQKLEEYNILDTLSEKNMKELQSFNPLLQILPFSLISPNRQKRKTMV